MFKRSLSQLNTTLGAKSEDLWALSRQIAWRKSPFPKKSTIWASKSNWNLILTTADVKKTLKTSRWYYYALTLLMLRSRRPRASPKLVYSSNSVALLTRVCQSNRAINLSSNGSYLSSLDQTCCSRHFMVNLSMCGTSCRSSWSTMPGTNGARARLSLFPLKSLINLSNLPNSLCSFNQLISQLLVKAMNNL